MYCSADAVTVPSPYGLCLSVCSRRLKQTGNLCRSLQGTCEPLRDMLFIWCHNMWVCLCCTVATATMIAKAVWLEAYSDANWSGSQFSRRSITGAVFFLDGAACRGQKVVSLSSCESEWYSAVSASCDLLFIKQCLVAILDDPIQTVVDNAAARPLAHVLGARASAVKGAVVPACIRHLQPVRHIHQSSFGTPLERSVGCPECC